MLDAEALSKKSGKYCGAALTGGSWAGCMPWPEFSYGGGPGGYLTPNSLGGKVWYVTSSLFACSILSSRATRCSCVSFGLKQAQTELSDDAASEASGCTLVGMVCGPHPEASESWSVVCNWSILIKTWLHGSQASRSDGDTLGALVSGLKEGNVILLFIC